MVISTVTLRRGLERQGTAARGGSMSWKFKKCYNLKRIICTINGNRSFHQRPGRQRLYCSQIANISPTSSSQDLTSDAATAVGPGLCWDTLKPAPQGRGASHTHNTSRANQMTASSKWRNFLLRCKRAVKTRWEARRGWRRAPINHLTQKQNSRMRLAELARRNVFH